MEGKIKEKMEKERGTAEKYIDGKIKVMKENKLRKRSGGVRRRMEEEEEEGKEEKQR